MPKSSTTSSGPVIANQWPLVRKVATSAAIAALAMALGLLTAVAGMDETLKAIQQSQFSFARSDSVVPFYPAGWAQDRFYPRTQFSDERGLLPKAEVVENTFDLGMLLPAYVAKRDMLILGADVALDSLDVRSGPYPDQSVLRLTPIAAWLHQFGENETVSAFVAPIFSKELQGDQPWGANGYGGVIGMHRFSGETQLLYGGVYEYNFGRSTGYPYLGVLWLPSPKWSLSLVFPWPTVAYAPRDRWLFQLGIAPGGSSWVSRANGFETTQTFGSWTLNAGAGYRLHGKFWLFAGAGVAGLRGVKIESSDDRPRFESKPGPVFTLALQVRP